MNLKKIKVQSLYVQISVWEIEVPDNISDSEQEDFAHDKVDEITAKLKLQEPPICSEMEGVKLIYETKLDEETQTVTEDIWEQYKVGKIR